MDSFVTFRDLLEIGTFLISLATFITSLYKKHGNRNHKKKKEITAPEVPQLVTVIL
ncbi:hypothetical protein [uncultured Ruminococcus sp.]|uniref:hypothetical protein n=1 Tax=uncultured Ruminococcus sp. TaxID=165186 RepID=UPI0025962695|nr:hypothetical protein [uncultured Ruminococcus sp.]